MVLIDVLKISIVGTSYGINSDGLYASVPANLYFAIRLHF